jgi:hypothetical protein
MTWDTKVPRLSDPDDNSANENGFRVLHNELWMDGESRSRIEQSFTRGRGYQLTRFGKTQASCTWQFGSTQPFVGTIWSADDPPGTARFEQLAVLEVNRQVGPLSMRVPSVFFRPFASDLLEQDHRNFRLASEEETVDGRRLVRLAVRNPPKNAAEEFWVDPARGDIIVKWQWQVGRDVVCSVSVDPTHDEHNGWLPLRWTEKVVSGRALLGTAVNTMTGFATSEEYPRDAFHVTFPEGTIVFDRRTKEQYTIGKDELRTHVLQCNSPESLKVFEALESPVTFGMGPEPLKDALDFIAARYQIAVHANPKAFGRAGIDLRTEVRASVLGAPLWHLLQLLLGQVEGRVTFEVRDGALVIAPVIPRSRIEKMLAQ